MQAPENVKGATARGSRPLFLCMVGLVLLNVAFVQLTEAASPAWLAPLYVLTLAAPLFARFRDNRIWRFAWNIGVLSFLGVLIEHALGRDLSSVLQDGLILAVLCQVHLLNNLHENQRPDLLFLNSYLIAVITGYITVDLGFAGAFFLYAPFYVLGLQFLSLARPGRGLSRADARIVFWDGARRSAVLVGAALVVFLFWPRDFQREALFAKYFEFEPSSGRTEVGFNDSLDVERKAGGAAQRDELVAKVTVVRRGQGAPSPPLLWRGGVLEAVDRRGAWKPLAGAPAGPAVHLWAEPDGRALGRPTVEPSAAIVRLRVEREGSTRRLFVPEGAQRLELDAVHSQGRLGPASGGGVAYSNPGSLRYTVDVPVTGEPIDLGRVTEARRGLLLEHESSAYTRSTLDLGARLTDRVGEGRSAVEVARSLAVYLASSYDYVPPGGDGAADTLHAFITGEAGGHCEFFASALALMLREAEIPARVVTGYRARPGAALGCDLVLSTAGAHAWVEFYDDEAGWITLDPTPAYDAGDQGPSLWQRARTALATLWRDVTGFDAARRAAAVAWLRAAPGRSWRAIREHPGSASGVAIAGVLLVILVKRLRGGRGGTRESRALLVGFQRAGHALAPGETPREALERVLPLLPEGDTKGAERLRSLVEQHEAARYARG